MGQLHIQCAIRLWDKHWKARSFIPGSDAILFQFATAPQGDSLKGLLLQFRYGNAGFCAHTPSSLSMRAVPIRLSAITIHLNIVGAKFLRKCFGKAYNIDAAIINFCKGTGLRRYEVAMVKPVNIMHKDGRLYLVDITGKGGKVREIEVIPRYEKAVRNAAMGKRTDKRIFPRIPSHMDVHGYRRNYAQALYDSIARPVKNIPRRDK